MSKKVAIITDTHLGCRKGSQIFHDYFESFYRDTFFPTLDERGIDTVLHMGDVFDVRKGIDYWSLDWSKKGGVPTPSLIERLTLASSLVITTFSINNPLRLTLLVST